MEEKHKRALFALMVAVLFIGLAWFLNLGGLKSAGLAEFAVFFASLGLSVFILTYGLEAGINPEHLYTVMFVIPVLALIVVSISFSTALLAGPGLLFVIGAIVPPLSFWVRETFVSKHEAKPAKGAKAGEEGAAKE